MFPISNSKKLSLWGTLTGCWCAFKLALEGTLCTDLPTEAEDGARDRFPEKLCLLLVRLAVFVFVLVRESRERSETDTSPSFILLASSSSSPISKKDGFFGTERWRCDAPPTTEPGWTGRGWLKLAEEGGREIFGLEVVLDHETPEDSVGADVKVDMGETRSVLVLVLALGLCPGPCTTDAPVRKLVSRGLGGGGRLCVPPLGLANPTSGVSGVAICSEPAVEGRLALAAGKDCRLDALERTDRLLEGVAPLRSIAGLEIDPLAYAPKGLPNVEIEVPADPVLCDLVLFAPKMGEASAAESLGSRLVLVLLARKAAKPTGVPLGANPLIAGYSKLVPGVRPRDRLGGECSALVCSLASSPSLSSSDGGMICCLGARRSSVLMLNTLIVGLSRGEVDVISSPICFKNGGDVPGTTPPVLNADGVATSWMINGETVRGELKCEAHSSSSMTVWPCGGEVDGSGTNIGLLEGERLYIR